MMPEDDGLDDIQETSGDDALREAAAGLKAAVAADAGARATALDGALAALVERVRAVGGTAITTDDVDLLARLRRADPGKYSAFIDKAAEVARSVGRKLRLVDLRRAVDARHREHQARASTARRLASQDFTTVPARSITIDFDLKRSADDGIEALAASSQLYQRCHRLVRIVRSHAPGSDGCDESTITVEEVPLSVLTEMLAVAAEFRARTDAGERRINPPASLAERIRDRHEYDPMLIPPLVAVSAAPIMLASGEVVSGRVFHRASGHFVDAPFIEVPERPTRDEAHAAASRVLAPFEDFRFRGDDTVQRLSRSVILAAILSALARPAIDGPVPATMVDADAPQAGKTLLAEAIGAIVLGRQIAVTPWSDDDEEQRKTLATIAMDGDAVALLDNLRADVVGTVLEGQLTATKIKPRLMGRQTAPEIPWRCTLLATANGVRFSSDAARRFRFVLMHSSYGREPHGEAPAQAMHAFRHRLLVRHVLKHREGLLRDALTVLRAHALAGRPSGATLPKFEAWSDVVSSAVLWACGSDPSLADGPSSLNRDHTTASAVVSAWCVALRDRSVTLAELRAQIALGEPRLMELRDALADLADVADLARASSKSLGMRLGRILERPLPAPWGGTMRVVAQPNRRGVLVYAALYTRPPPGSANAALDAEDHPAAEPGIQSPSPHRWSEPACDLWREQHAIASESGTAPSNAAADIELGLAIASGEVRDDG